MQHAHLPTHAPVPLLDQALAYLAATKGRWPEVSRVCGVPYSTMTKLYQGVIEDPRVSTVQRLLDHRDTGINPGIYPEKDSDTEKIPEFGEATHPTNVIESHSRDSVDSPAASVAAPVDAPAAIA